jgi:hypothetical protein
MIVLLPLTVFIFIFDILKVLSTIVLLSLVSLICSILSDYSTWIWYNNSFLWKITHISNILGKSIEKRKWITTGGRFLLLSVLFFSNFITTLLNSALVTTTQTINGEIINISTANYTDPGLFINSALPIADNKLQNEVEELEKDS